MSMVEQGESNDARRWAGVAALLVTYLDLWLAGEAPPPPRGVLAGAKRFLTQALEGLYLDVRLRRHPEVPVVTAFRARDVAVRVRSRMGESSGRLEDLLWSHLGSLNALDQGRERSDDLARGVQSLRGFFRALWDEAK